MKNLLLVASVLLFGLAFSQDIPKVQKKEFSSEALSQKITDEDGRKVSVKDILQEHKGKILVIDFWASWCKDCILALPKSKELVEKNPDVHFVYFSLDRSKEQWKKGLDKHGIADKENYWFEEGWKNKFNNYMDLNWIPRFVLVDQNGNIANYYAISPDDSKLTEKITELRNQK